MGRLDLQGSVRSALTHESLYPMRKFYEQGKESPMRRRQPSVKEMIRFILTQIVKVVFSKSYYSSSLRITSQFTLQSVQTGSGAHKTSPSNTQRELFPRG